MLSDISLTPSGGLLVPQHQTLLDAREQAGLELILRKQENEITAWVGEMVEGLLEGEEFKGVIEKLDMLGEVSRCVASSPCVAFSGI